MAPSQSELTLEDLQRWQEKASPRAAREPEVYFEELMGQFRKAFAGSATASAHYFKIGPYRAKFLFACESLAASLSLPFLHLKIEPTSSPDLTVGFWESSTNGLALHPPRWSELQGSRVSLHNPETFIQYDFATEILSALRSRDNMGLLWVKDGNQIFFSEKVCPARPIFHWLTKNTSLQLIHGGAVGNDTGAALLVGRGGSGKSTSCSTALQSELYFLGDDYCLIDINDSPTVYSLYASTKINPDMLDKFAHLKKYRIEPSKKEAEKPSFLIFDAFKDRLRPSLPLKAILIPQVKGNLDTRIIPASSMQGLHSLAPSTLFQSTAMLDGSFRKMARLSRNLPCFYLEPGTDLDGIPSAIDSLLKSL